MFKPRQKLGKYRIERKLGEGAFGVVYRAFDTIEGVRVALKVPYPKLVDRDVLEGFRAEVRLAAKLDHPNILPLKNAEFIAGHFVIVTVLGDRTLEDRLRSRISLKTALSFADQMIDAVAYAHERRIIHCDVKPDNILLFGRDRIRLADFGIAKVAMRTIEASGSGTLGYVAPEQALGRPSTRSDVFSLGLILYRMVTGVLPEWPYEWPLPRPDRIRRLHPDVVDILRRSVQPDARRRFRDAVVMLRAFRKAKVRALRHESRRKGRAAGPKGVDWQTVRRREFRRRYGTSLETAHQCRSCEGPVSETMLACPWCGVRRKRHREETRFPSRCSRCGRGLKLDWRYCPWCYGAGFDRDTSRKYSDRRYAAKCSAPGCDRRLLMPFMRYCPWCRRKVAKKWRIEGSTETCPSCGWGIVSGFWAYCPWCTKRLAHPHSRATRGRA